MLRLSSCLLALFLAGCATEEPRERGRPWTEWTEVEVLLQQSVIDLNKGIHKDLIEQLKTELVQKYPNTAYNDAFNGMDAVLVREFISDNGGVVWSNGIYLPSVFSGFMQLPDSKESPSIGLAVQDNVVVGTIAKKKE